MVYCVQLTAPYSTCPVSFVYQHTQQNSANYNGSGTVSVCQKLTVGGVNQNRTCGNNYTASPVANWGEVRSWAGNNSPNNHTISGIATGS